MDTQLKKKVMWYWHHVESSMDPVIKSMTGASLGVKPGVANVLPEGSHFILTVARSSVNGSSVESSRPQDSLIHLSQAES